MRPGSEEIGAPRAKRKQLGETIVKFIIYYLYVKICILLSWKLKQDLTESVCF